MKLEPIRLRFVPREAAPEQSNPREAFWRWFPRAVDRSGDIRGAEMKLQREFGPALRVLLVQELSEPLRQLNHALFGDLEYVVSIV